MRVCVSLCMRAAEGASAPCVLMCVCTCVHAGAYGATISGAGPTAVAIVDSLSVGERVQEAMCRAFKDAGKLDVNSAKVVRLDPVGAKIVK